MMMIFMIDSTHYPQHWPISRARRADDDGEMVTSANESDSFANEIIGWI